MGRRWLVLAVALLAAACSGGGSSPTTGPSNNRTTGSPPSSSGPLQIGTVKLGGATTSHCASGFRCQAFSVTCSGLEQAARGLLEVERPSGTPRGLVLYFSGQSGQEPWVTPSTDQATLPFMQDVAGAGLTNVMVAWEQPWLVSAPGEQAGPARLACRAASVIRYVHDTMYAQLGVHPSPQRCGFCLAGESGGASEVA